MPKAYEAKEYEDKIYTAWEKSGYFNPDNLPGERKEIFSIVLPPPNVTGTLHLGHAVMLAVEDAMVRFARLQGKKTLWVPGTDHAAIATQAKVEKIILKEEGKTRHDLGREKFLKRVEKFAQESHDTIVNQTKKMGSSLDWSREAFTLDEDRTKAVRRAFAMMYEDGLIYRGDKVVNWCSRCQSTLSDDELEYQEKTAGLYTFKYDQDFPIAISTTRPETKLGDTGVAVHPKDKRYKKYIGETFQVEFLGNQLLIKVVADEGVDPKFGTGALGVTPAHSKVDEQIAKKNNLESLVVIDEDGKMTKQAGQDFADLDVLKAREKVVAGLKKKKLILQEEEVAHNLSVCYRCGTPVEPLPKLQWFIDVNKPFVFRQSKTHPIKGVKNGQKISLKKIMQQVVKSGQIAIMPDRFNKTYFHWIDNLRDWNISRQIWYGHQVPVWYKARKSQITNFKVQTNSKFQISNAKQEEMVVGEKPKGSGWVQDTDTLDTWFSSGLWTISTLGWPSFAKASEGKPGKASDFATYHPTSVLETGYDILFFWIARMILMTTYCVGEIPFEQVYLHGLVRDEQGRKMSKSLGNVIDPLNMIAKYGADATRLSLVIGGTLGNDMKLSEEKVAGYRNFTNKLWNISRFILTTARPPLNPPLGKGGKYAVTLADKWILGRFETVNKEVTKHLEKHEFSMAGEILRDFTWSELADWYLEIAKIQRQDEKLAKSTDQVLLFILERLLIMWHPFMPFVTEQIWSHLGKKEQLIVAIWPKVEELIDKKAEQDFRLVQETVSAIRNLRSQYKIEPARQDLTAIVENRNQKLFFEQEEVIKSLARLSELRVEVKADKPDGLASVVLDQTTVYLLLVGVVDVKKEKERLKKELINLEKYLKSLEAQLNNKEMIKKAPLQVMDNLKSKKQDAEQKLIVIKDQLNSL